MHLSQQKIFRTTGVANIFILPVRTVIIEINMTMETVLEEQNRKKIIGWMLFNAELYVTIAVTVTCFLDNKLHTN